MCVDATCAFSPHVQQCEFPEGQCGGAAISYPSKSAYRYSFAACGDDVAVLSVDPGVTVGVGK